MSEQYWALQAGDDFVAAVKKRVRDYDQYLDNIGRIERISKAYEFVYGLNDGAYGIRKTGKAGEIVKISINNFRAFLNNIHVLLTQAKSYFEVQAQTMDTSSQAQTIIGKSIVDHYLDEAGLSQDFSQVVYYTLVFGEHFLEIDWDESKGEPKAFGDQEVTTGDITVRLHNTINVIRDVNLKTHKKNRYYIIRDYENKYDLAATYPEHEEYILEQGAKKHHYSDFRRDSIYRKIVNMQSNSDEIIEILRVYHDDCRACVGGKEALIIGDRIIYQRPLKENYKHNPIHRLAAQDIEGSFLAYSPCWDLISLCEVSDHLTTAQVTNAVNLAFTNIWSQDPNLKISQLSSAMGLINSSTKPETLNLASNSPEIEKSLAMLHQKAQFLTGINSVAAGQPEAVSNIKSGNGLALILSTAVQFQQILQDRYADFRSNVMTSLIEILQKKATFDMLISVSGVGKASYVKTFKKDDISDITRVRLSLQSPIMSMTGGRLEVTNNIKNLFPESVSIDAYVSVLETGNLDHLKANHVNSRQAILAENEALQTGKPVVVNILENHKAHIEEHMALISTPDAKQNLGLVESVTEHVFAHLEQWKAASTLYPELLSVIGIPSIAPTPAPMPMESGGGDAKPVSADPMAEPEPNLPSMPKLPNAAPEGLSASYDQVNSAEMALQ